MSESQLEEIKRLEKRLEMDVAMLEAENQYLEEPHRGKETPRVELLLKEIERLRLIEAAARDMLCERDRAVEGGYHSELAGTAHKLRMALEKGEA